MSKEKIIEGLLIEPNQYPRKLKIENELSAFQKAVKGYIECIDLPYNDSTIICNEEGKINGEKLNRILYNDNNEIVDVVAGTMFVIGFNAEEGEFVSLTSKQSDEITKLFMHPDMFFKIDDTVHMVSIDWLFDFCENDIVFSDRNTCEEKHRISCKNDLEQIKLYAFINRKRSEIIRNMSCEIKPIEISTNNEPIKFCYDIGDEER